MRSSLIQAVHGGAAGEPRFDAVPQRAFFVGSQAMQHHGVAVRPDGKRSRRDARESLALVVGGQRSRDILRFHLKRLVGV